MTVISKELFYKCIDSGVHCKELHIWNDDCRKIYLHPYIIVNVVKGTAKFFLPIYLLKLMINYKRINDIDFLKSLIIAEATSIVYGIVMAGLFLSTICLLRKIFGRVHYYNLVFFPATVSGLSLLVESGENQVLNPLIFFNSFVETVLKYVHFYFIKSTVMRETLLFMGVSAVLMNLLENRKKKLDMIYFWFYTPSKKKDGNESEGKICCHKNTCKKFWGEGFVKYFALGYFINVIRRVIPKLPTLTKRPRGIINVLFGKSNARFGLFIGAYAATYRILTCYLLKWGKVKRKFHGLVAGFFSGITYAISPNIQVLVTGITTILQIYYTNVSSKLNITNHFWPRQFLYMLCHGFLFHMKICDPKCCSPYYKNMVDMCTNNLVSKIFKNLLSKFFANDINISLTKHIPSA